MTADIPVAAGMVEGSHMQDEGASHTRPVGLLLPPPCGGRPRCAGRTSYRDRNDEPVDNPRGVCVART